MEDFLTSGFTLFFIFALYLTLCIPLYVMGKKTGQDNPWFAFVPILNTILMLQIADKELWWFLLLLIPLVNVIVAVLVWMAIADAMDKPEWVGALMLVPFVNLAVPWYLAFG